MCTVVTCAVLFCFVLLLLFIFVFFLRYTVRESGMGPAPVFVFGHLTPRDASPCVCLPRSFIWFDWCPPFPPSSFLFRCVTYSLSLSLSSYLGCLALLIWLPFFRSLLRIFFLSPRVLYVAVLCLFRLCLPFISWFSLLNPFLATMFFADYFHACFFLSVFFPVCLLCFVHSDRVRSRFVLV